MPIKSITLPTVALLGLSFLSGTDLLLAQSNTTVVTNNPTGTVVVSDTSNRQLGLKDNTQDRVTLIDGTVMIGKITEMSAARVMIKVAGQDLALDPARIEKVERNLPYDPDADKRRAVEVQTKDGSRYRGTITKADAATTTVKTATGEVPVRNENIENILYLDAEKARQADAIAARPQKWEVSLKGGATFYQLGRFNNLLAPGYFGLLSVEAPHFVLPGAVRLSPGLSTGFYRNVGKNDKDVSLELFPGLLSVAASYQLGRLPLDVYAGGLVGVTFVRGKRSGANAGEDMALDFSYGADLGFKYFITPTITARLGSQWFAVRETSATLNHVMAYLAVGMLF